MGIFTKRKEAKKKAEQAAKREQKRKERQESSQYRAQLGHTTLAVNRKDAKGAINALLEGKLVERIDYKTKDISYEWTKGATLTREEAKSIIKTYGKRAQSRLTTLRKAYETGTLKRTQPSDILVKYAGFDVKTKDLSDKELIKKARTAIEILNKKGTLVSKVTAAKRRAYDTFKANHNLPDLTYAEYEKLMIQVGQFQQLNADKDYDSTQTLLMMNWIDKTGGEGVDLLHLETLNPEVWFLNMAREEETGKWISMQSIEEGDNIPEDLPF